MSTEKDQRALKEHRTIGDIQCIFRDQRPHLVIGLAFAVVISLVGFMVYEVFTSEIYFRALAATIAAAGVAYLAQNYSLRTLERNCNDAPITDFMRQELARAVDAAKQRDVGLPPFPESPDSMTRRQLLVWARDAEKHIRARPERQRTSSLSSHPVERSDPGKFTRGGLITRRSTDFSTTSGDE